MRLTLKLDDELHRQAKATAAEQGVTLNRFIEEALWLRLEQRVVRREVKLHTYDSGRPFDSPLEELNKLGQE